MLLAPGEVVVVVHLMDRVGAEDLEHLGDDDVAAGVRVLAGELHRLDVRVAELGAELEQHRRRVHLALGALPSNGSPCASARNPDAVLWPKPREPKWTPTQIRPCSSSIRLT